MEERGVVTVYCSEQGDKRVRRAVGWLMRNNIDYQLVEISYDTFSFDTFLKFLEMTVEGLEEILTTKGSGHRQEILEGKYTDEPLSNIYQLVVEDPEYLDLPLMIDEQGRTATLGARRGNNDYENMTVFTKTEPVDIGLDGELEKMTY